MAKSGWFKESARHSLAAKGIPTGNLASINRVKNIENNDAYKCLASAIAKSGTNLAHQPRKWAKEALKQFAATPDKAVLIRARIDYKKDVYTVTPHGDVNLVANGVTWARAKVIADTLRSGAKYSDEVWDNYVTGGYTTRIGLKRAEASAKTRVRTKAIQQSHEKYNEMDYSGEAGHKLRTRFRN